MNISPDMNQFGYNLHEYNSKKEGQDNSDTTKKIDASASKVFSSGSNSRSPYSSSATTVETLRDNPYDSRVDFRPIESVEPLYTTAGGQSTPPPSVMNQSPPDSADSKASVSSLGSLCGAFDAKSAINNDRLPVSASRGETGSFCNIFGGDMDLNTTSGFKRKGREATVFDFSTHSYNPDTSNAPKKR